MNTFVMNDLYLESEYLLALSEQSLLFVLPFRIRNLQ